MSGRDASGGARPAPGCSADGEAVITRYLSAMAASDLAGVLACFAVGATVRSPVYGRMAVEPFYATLFANTVRVALSTPRLYRAVGACDAWIAHFGYQWERHDGEPMDTELIDFFRINGAGLITELRIVIAGRG